MVRERGFNVSAGCMIRMMGERFMEIRFLKHVHHPVRLIHFVVCIYIREVRMMGVKTHVVVFSGFPAS